MAATGLQMLMVVAAAAQMQLEQIILEQLAGMGALELHRLYPGQVLPTLVAVAVVQLMEQPEVAVLAAAVVVALALQMEPMEQQILVVAAAGLPIRQLIMFIPEVTAVQAL